MLIDEIAYYKENKKEITSLHEGKFIIIKGKEIIGVCNTRSQANDEALKLHAIGSFIIEHPLTLK